MYESQVPIKPYSYCFSRVFQASICIATYGMSVPSLHTESIDSVIVLPLGLDKYVYSASLHRMKLGGMELRQLSVCLSACLSFEIFVAFHTPRSTGSKI